jgi:hypothetical protein
MSNHTSWQWHQSVCSHILSSCWRSYYKSNWSVCINFTISFSEIFSWIVDWATRKLSSKCERIQTKKKQVVKITQRMLKINEAIRALIKTYNFSKLMFIFIKKGFWYTDTRTIRLTSASVTLTLASQIRKEFFEKQKSS